MGYQKKSNNYNKFKRKIDKLLLKSNHYMNQIHCFFDQIKYNKFQKMI